MKLGYAFAVASGSSKDDCHWLGYRFNQEHGFSPEDGESWLAQSSGGQSFTLLFQRGWWTGLWRTGAKVWVSDIGGRVFMNPSLEVRKEPWQTFRLDASLSGIWGLRDDLVFTWGLRRSAPVAFLYDGTSWREIGAPGHIGCVRGIRDDLIYAVGLRGLIARWNGSSFQTVHGPTDGNLCDVFVASDDEMYACGHGGHLLQGTVHGWEVLLKHDGPLHCVAEWHDDVWVGAGPGGLFKVANERLDLIKPNIHAERFDTRGDLLITAPDVIAETKDAMSFQAIFVKVIELCSAQEPPSWGEDELENELEEDE
jgi:hypothetical protein